MGLASIWDAGAAAAAWLAREMALTDAGGMWGDDQSDFGWGGWGGRSRIRLGFVWASMTVQEGRGVWRQVQHVNRNGLWVICCASLSMEMGRRGVSAHSEL